MVVGGRVPFSSPAVYPLLFHGVYLLYASVNFHIGDCHHALPFFCPRVSFRWPYHTSGALLQQRNLRVPQRSSWRAICVDSRDKDLPVRPTDPHRPMALGTCGRPLLLHCLNPSDYRLVWNRNHDDGELTLEKQCLRTVFLDVSSSGALPSEYARPRAGAATEAA